ncbi:hypothetical protein LXL04_037966 [Taraxacum kok-saghyz]
MSASRRPRADLRGCSVFVFLKCEEVKTSARGLLGTDLVQCLQTSSNFNLITLRFNSRSPPSRFNTRLRGLQQRSSSVFSSDRRHLQHRSSPPYKPSISVPISADFTLFHPISSSAPLQPISADFTRFLHYKDRSNFSILFGKLSILYVVFWLLAMGEKHQWSNDQIKCLLETCIEEVNTIGRKGLSLHKDSWNKVGRVLKDNFGVDLTKKQLKNAYDNLKAKYTGWIYLKNKTGNLYNPQTNTFNLTAEEWDEFKKGHPKAASLKTTDGRIFVCSFNEMLSKEIYKALITFK